MKIIDFRFRPNTPEIINGIKNSSMFKATCEAIGFDKRVPQALPEIVADLDRRGVELCGAIFRHNHRMNTSGVRATQARAEVVRIGYAVEDQQERLIERSDQIRQIVFLILPSWLHTGDNALMHGTVAFLVEILTVRQLDNHALGLKGVNQR